MARSAGARARGRVLSLAGVVSALTTIGGGAAYSQSGFQDPGSGPPDIDRLDAKPRLIDEGDWVDFIAQASDPDGRTLKYRWDFGDGEAAEDDGAVDIASITHRYLRSRRLARGTERPGPTLPIQSAELISLGG